MALAIYPPFQNYRNSSSNLFLALVNKGHNRNLELLQNISIAAQNDSKIAANISFLLSLSLSPRNELPDFWHSRNRNAEKRRVKIAPTILALRAMPIQNQSKNIPDIKKKAAV